jgi:hypothetical protein
MRKRNRIIITGLVVLAVLGVGLYALRNNGRPQNITLKVAGEPGQQVIGFITADGVTQKVLGTLPLKVDYRASRTEFAFVPAQPQGGNPSSVHVAVDGQEWGYCTDPEGIKGSLERTGIAGWGVNAGGIGGMNTMEVAAVAR